MVPTADLLATPPPELLARVVEQANLDADLTIHVLNAAGLAPLPGQTRFLPRDLLLELGAALRVMVWEIEGLDLPAFTLPTPQDAIRRAFVDAVGRLRDPSYSASPSLSQTVLQISTYHLAWVGSREFQAEILLDTPDEDALVEAMAQLLWRNRGLLSAAEGDEMS